MVLDNADDDSVFFALPLTKIPLEFQREQI